MMIAVEVLFHVSISHVIGAVIDHVLMAPESDVTSALNLSI